MRFQLIFKDKARKLDTEDADIKAVSSSSSPV